MSGPSVRNAGPHTRNMTFLPASFPSDRELDDAPNRLRHQLFEPAPIASSIAALPMRPTASVDDGAAGWDGPSEESTNKRRFSLSGCA